MLDAATVLVTAPAFQSAETTVCTRLLTATESTSLVGVTLGQPAEKWLSAIAERLDGLPPRVWVVDIVHADAADENPTIDYPDTEATIRSVQSPGNLTDLGVAITDGVRTLSDEGAVPLCFDALGPLYQYVDSKAVFQFVQVLTNHLGTHGSRGHFHLNPAAVDDEDLASLELLMDATVTVTEDDWTVERRE